ncbi:hypothetical protein B0T10DRAFT_260978 [Thelonectria olida]|uniref:Uncharacterized protein n=1 Tax=Thelonectria olida TaxID=1576542 RepID=A0A9P8VRF3_9HYPO|nr:hypothetical protein B0T10DRAFT_260978 [Thelonectria olida]
MVKSLRAVLLSAGLLASSVAAKSDVPCSDAYSPNIVSDPSFEWDPSQTWQFSSADWTWAHDASNNHYATLSGNSPAQSVKQPISNLAIGATYTWSLNFYGYLGGQSSNSRVTCDFSLRWSDDGSADSQVATGSTYYKRGERDPSWGQLTGEWVATSNTAWFVFDMQCDYADSQFSVSVDNAAMKKVICGTGPELTPGTTPSNTPTTPVDTPYNTPTDIDSTAYDTPTTPSTPYQTPTDIDSTIYDTPTTPCSTPVNTPIDSTIYDTPTTPSTPYQTPTDIDSTIYDTPTTPCSTPVNTPIDSTIYDTPTTPSTPYHTPTDIDSTIYDTPTTPSTPYQTPTDINSTTYDTPTPVNTPSTTPSLSTRTPSTFFTSTYSSTPASSPTTTSRGRCGVKQH